MFERLKQAFSDKFGGVNPDMKMGLDGNSPIQPGLPGTLREALFADTALPELLRTLAPSALAEEPWSNFAAAQHAIDGGRESDAIPALRAVLHRFESRIDLLAWTALRKLGVQPAADEAKRVLGVVVEIPGEYGLDLVAAYLEHTARYYNYSGAAVIWEAQDPQVDSLIDSMLAAGQRVAQAIGPWEGGRPAPPTNDRARINILTPSGLHFGEGPTNSFMQDAYAGPVIGAAFRLMQALMEKQQQSSYGSTNAQSTA